jgi:hypothetical protein
MTKVTLTNALTPKMRKIWMQNPNALDDPDFVMECPELRECSLYYWGLGDYECWVQRLLDHATKLERFDSYKLRVERLKFASNHLESIRLHRAELWSRIDLWAPRLTNLDVQSAYDLEEIHFLRDHHHSSALLKRQLPRNFQCREELCVNAMNACLSRQALEALRAHPRVDSASLMASMQDDDDMGFW